MARQSHHPEDLSPMDDLDPDLSTLARWAVGMTLLDLHEARATLWGALIRYDVHTGAELPQPRPDFAPYNGLVRRGLPSGWEHWCWRRGLLRQDMTPGLPHWVPTDEAVQLAEKWIAGGGPPATEIPDDDESEAHP